MSCCPASYTRLLSIFCLISRLLSHHLPTSPDGFSSLSLNGTELKQFTVLLFQLYLGFSLFYSSKCLLWKGSVRQSQSIRAGKTVFSSKTASQIAWHSEDLNRKLCELIFLIYKHTEVLLKMLTSGITVNFLMSIWNETFLIAKFKLGIFCIYLTAFTEYREDTCNIQLTEP